MKVSNVDDESLPSSAPVENYDKKEEDKLP